MAISAGASLPSSPESGSVMTANCQHCGQHFQTRPYALRKGQGKFCSRICSDRAAPRSTFVCQQCAQSFSILTCKVRSKQRRLFCSRVCQQLARSARVTCICTECQQSFSLVKSQVEKGRGIFCSRTCQRRAHLRQPVSMEQRRATSKRANEAYRRRHPERFRLRRFRRHLKRYGLTPEHYDTMVAQQGGGCGICGAKEPGARRKVFHADHCHKTGTFRGFLCGACNMILGQFNDDPERFRAAAAYLEHHRARTKVA